MEINNILVSTSREGYYSINFDIVGENVNVYLSIDNEEYQEIFTNQSTSSLNYGDILSTGGHTAKLKISNELEEIQQLLFDCGHDLATPAEDERHSFEFHQKANNIFLYLLFFL